MTNFWTILTYFWTNPGPILDPFWTNPGPVLVPSCTRSGPVMHLFRHAPVLVPSCTGSGPVLVPSCTGSGPVMHRFWSRHVPPPSCTATVMYSLSCHRHVQQPLYIRRRSFRFPLGLWPGEPDLRTTPRRWIYPPKKCENDPFSDPFLTPFSGNWVLISGHPCISKQIGGSQNGTQNRAF